jgi:hypothetical protein
MNEYFSQCKRIDVFVLSDEAALNFHNMNRAGIPKFWGNFYSGSEVLMDAEDYDPPMWSEYDTVEKLGGLLERRQQKRERKLAYHFRNVASAV